MPAAQAGGGAPTYYLALGDSLAAGFQPGKGETPGYVGMLWRSVRNDQIPSLELRNVGCSGETSGSLITGNHSPCHYAAGSQLNAAVDFLEAHVGEVAFVTIDIGANDIVGQCFGPSGLIPTSCVADLRPGLKHRVRAIVDALATAAPGVPIVGMRYYDPFLGLWGLDPRGSRPGACRPTCVDGVQRCAHECLRARRRLRRRCGDDLPDRRLRPHRGGSGSRSGPGERRPRLPMDVVLLGQAHVRRARESNRLPQDRDHVPPGPEAAAPDLGPIFERTRRFRRAALRGTSRL